MGQTAECDNRDPANIFNARDNAMAYAKQQRELSDTATHEGPNKTAPPVTPDHHEQLLPQSQRHLGQHHEANFCDKSEEVSDSETDSGDDKQAEVLSNDCESSSMADPFSPEMW